MSGGGSATKVAAAAGSELAQLLKLSDPGLLKTKAYVGGKWIGAVSNKLYPVVNPATGEVIVEVPDMGTEDVKDAVDVAHEGFQSWKAKTAKDRSTILRRFFDLMVESKNDLGTILTAEAGKPLAEARGEIMYGSSFIEWFAEEGKRTYGQLIPETDKSKRFLVKREPIGVCGIITPWNFPNAMITRKAGAALAAGCSIVARPAEDTPLSALAIAELAERAGIPPGVFNVVTSSRDNASAIGKELSSNSLVKKLSFTGSTSVGKILMKQSSDTVKKLSLELGGNAPFIVFEDADIDMAVRGLMNSKFRNSGQTCVCANRVFVHEDVHDEFVEKFTHEVERLKVGDGMEKGVSQGPLINESAVEKVDLLVQDALQKGALATTGGERHPLGGNFYSPTVLMNCDLTMMVSSAEIFGPIAPIFKFAEEDEVVQWANNVPVGLASYFYTNNLQRGFRVADALEYGMVGFNEGLISSEVAPFGGVKESGLGREGSFCGIDEYLEYKYICMGGM
eukprot:Nk52_evm20s2578 gene=Nk52_evmTU20s2578